MQWSSLKPLPVAMDRQYTGSYHCDMDDAHQDDSHFSDMGDASEEPSSLLNTAYGRFNERSNTSLAFASPVLVNTAYGRGTVVGTRESDDTYKVSIDSWKGGDGSRRGGSFAPVAFLSASQLEPVMMGVEQTNHFGQKDAPSTPPTCSCTLRARANAAGCAVACAVGCGGARVCADVHIDKPFRITKSARVSMPPRVPPPRATVFHGGCPLPAPR